MHVGYYAVSYDKQYEVMLSVLVLSGYFDGVENYRREIGRSVQLHSGQCGTIVSHDFLDAGAERIGRLAV